MSISGWLGGQLGKKHLELCKILAIDRNIANDVWKHFLQHYDEYLLEGDPIHWLGCCLYLRYPSGSAIPCSNKPPTLNLTKLLRNTNLSLVLFFQKAKKWAEICRMPQPELVRFESLQRGFSVSMVAFKSFRAIYNDIFIDPLKDTSKALKYKKLKSVPTSKKLFEFIWTLYICVKSYFPRVKDDLVDSYHLLLAACDYAYANAISCNRKDIINPKFMEIKTGGGRFPIANGDTPCIIDILCQRHNGVPIQAKQVKEYFWKKRIKYFFDRRYLKGNSENLGDTINPAYIDYNLKTIDKSYDDYILSFGVFDERLFLAQSFFTEIAGTGLEQKVDEMTSQLDSKSKMSPYNRVPGTPLTAKQFLKDSYHDPPSVAPTTTSVNNLAILQSMLYGRTSEPSSYLVNVLEKVGKITPSIETKVSDMAQMVIAHFTEATDDHDPLSESLAQSRLDMSKKLYFRFLDKLIMRESKNPSFRAKSLLNHDIFHKSLFACAVEVVIFTYRSRFVFPWILETLHISAYHFSRIIEVVVRADRSMSREMVKHLNWVEEIVLERLAWQSDSPLWKAINESNLPIPSCSDVSFGQNRGDETSEIQDKLSSLAGDKSSLINSPGVPLSEKFLSPTPSQTNGKRPLENDCDEPPPKIRVIGELPMKVESVGDKDKPPKRTGAIALFFRKFYYLAAVRLLDMCEQLSLDDKHLRQKIWTSFELTIVKHVNLMIDRHLDQILMCSIYVICKIVGPEQKFTDMMKCYRNQPQAQSCVYRNVLLGPERSLSDLNDPNVSKRTMRNTGDLIQFYNKVFLDKVEDLVRRFKTGNGIDKDRMVLSPIPYNLSNKLNSSWRRISDSHSVYIRYLSEKSPSISPSSPHFTYYFSQSPVQNLRAVNNIKCSEIIKGKRLLDSENLEQEISSSPAVNKKVKDLFQDRMANKTKS